MLPFRPDGKFRWRLSVLAVCLLGLAPRPAAAAFQFCNNTAYLIEAAFGYNDPNPPWTSEGWWQIQPGQCARVFSRPLTQRFYFYYARELTKPKDGRPPLTWKGKYSFCVAETAFKVEGPDNCERRGFTTLGFSEIDIGVGQRDYRLTFEDKAGGR